MIKKYIALFVFCLIATNIFAQSAKVKGIIINDQTGTGVGNATVLLDAANIASLTTDSTGNFLFGNVPYGKYNLSVKMNGSEISHVEINVNSAEINVGEIKVTVPAENLNADAIPTISLSENELKESGDASVAGTLSASRDAFVAATSYTFGISRFQIRGYDNAEFTTYMNGAEISDLTDSRTPYYLYGGLNNMMRNQEYIQFTNPATFAYGNLGATNYIDSRASKQRKQLEISYAASNRSYDNRLMLSYGTGLLKGGWAVAVSGSRRWADEGYVKGTYYDGWSYFASIEKIFQNKHYLSLSVMGSPSEYGRGGPSTMEMFDIAGTNYYNPYWGFQDGKIRNASVSKSHQPVSILAYEWRINSKSTLNASASYISGISKLSALDWYNAPDPRPDYYRYLPTYWQADAPDLANQIDGLLRNNEDMRQIDWDNLYNVNYFSHDSVMNADGIEGNTVVGKRARYVLADRVTKNSRIGMNVYYNNTLSDKLHLSAGFTHQNQVSESYQEIKDLLGAEFFVDWNQFAERDFPGNTDALQNDLNRPNRILHVGDKYGYDYKAYVQQTASWGQLQLKTAKVDGYAALKLGNSIFWREGLVQNGIFPDNSYGNSEKKIYYNYAVKAGATYKLNGRNFIYVNGSALTRAPLFDNAFVSARTRNDLPDNLKSEKVYSIDGGYMLKSPRLKARATAYFTQFNDATETRSFYHDEYRTLVNYTLTNIDRTHAGVELSAEANLGNGFSVSAVACMGRNLITDRPLATVTQDNSAEVLAKDETIYAENFHEAGGPEDAFTLGINYRSPKFWFININFNYFANTYIAINPARRTQQAIDLVDPNSEQWSNIIDQEKMPSQFTMDIFGGYSWRINNKYKALKKQTFLVFNLGLTNILNNTEMVSGGFEQGRFDFVEHNPDKFQSKYFYSYGTTFYASVALRLN